MTDPLSRGSQTNIPLAEVAQTSYSPDIPIAAAVPAGRVRFRSPSACTTEVGDHVRSDKRAAGSNGGGQTIAWLLNGIKRRPSPEVRKQLIKAVEKFVSSNNKSGPLNLTDEDFAGALKLVALKGDDILAEAHTASYGRLGMLAELCEAAPEAKLSDIVSCLNIYSVTREDVGEDILLALKAFNDTRFEDRPLDVVKEVVSQSGRMNLERAVAFMKIDRTASVEDIFLQARMDQR